MNIKEHEKRCQSIEEKLWNLIWNRQNAIFHVNIYDLVYNSVNKDLLKINHEDYKY